MKVKSENKSKQKGKIKRAQDENVLRPEKFAGEKKSRKDIRKQKKHNAIATFILVAILIGICGYISVKVFFIVQTVDVEGSEKYSRREIANFCAIPFGENIFNVDTEYYQNALPENFTYIETATVQRKLPNKIKITVVDSVPTYYEETSVDGGTAYTVYSQSLKPLTGTAQKPDNLIGIWVNQEDENSLGVFNSVVEFITDGGYDKVTQINTVQTDNISIEYDGRITVKLGTMLDMAYKLKMAYYVLHQKIPDGERGVMDATDGGNVIYRMTA